MNKQTEEALRMAIEYLREYHNEMYANGFQGGYRCIEIIDACKAALESQDDEQEFFRRGKELAKSIDANGGYWCIFCQRFIEADEYGIIVHDEGVDHDYADFNEERNPQ